MERGVEMGEGPSFERDSPGGRTAGAFLRHPERRFTSGECQLQFTEESTPRPRAASQSTPGWKPRVLRENVVNLSDNGASFPDRHEPGFEGIRLRVTRKIKRDIWTNRGEVIEAPSKIGAGCAILSPHLIQKKMIFKLDQ